MARPQTPPAPLPPETRPVGQLVAETIRLYGRNVWASLALGVPAAVMNLAVADLSRDRMLMVVPLLGAVLLAGSYVAACAVAHREPLRSRAALTAWAVGAIVFVGFPFLVVLYILPGLAYLALFGLAVPAALIEKRGVLDSLRRGVELARADYIHALGSLAALALVVLVTQGTVSFLLRSYADNTERTASFLAALVLSPLLFLGAATLYVDQAARVGSPRSTRRRPDAAVPDADDAHGEGRPDAELQPRPPA